jgi:hypothetical protein
MSGGGGGASKSVSQPKILPGQEAVWRYFGSDVLPLARGQETWLTKMLEQSGRDEGERQRQLANTNTMELATKTGMGPGEVASLQKDAQAGAVQGNIKNVAESRRALALQSMSMISGIPMISQKTVSKTKGKKSYAFGLYSG